MLIDALKTFPQYLIPKKSLTILAGMLANVTCSSVKNPLIRHFIRAYQVNMQEALIEDPTQYACFNDFFIRYLKPACRPLAKADIVSPVDGFVSEIGAITQGQLIQAKQRYYSVQELLACDAKKAETFTNGRFATLYLSPKDYHRIHMPLDATLTSMTYIPGSLFSVQPSTARSISKLFARNERLVVYFDTAFGAMAMVLVGATIVGAIGTSWHGEIKRCKKPRVFDYSAQSVKTRLAQGDEMGFFKLGSTVILLFANPQVQWEASFTSGTPLCFGQAMGKVTIPSID